MARTIDEIQTEIITNIQSDANLSEANSTSVSAIWRLITRVVATAIASLENLWDVYRSALISDIEILKPHTAKWYQNKSLNYLHGFTLKVDDDDYDLTGIDDATIAAAKIVTAAAAVEQNGTLVLKVNKLVGEDLEPLSVGEYAGFAAYVAEIKDAGVELQVLSFAADKMLIEVDVYYDPLILGSDGNRVDGSLSVPQPVKQQIKNFLQALPFNGQFVKGHLTDSLQAVEGVFMPVIRSCKVARFDDATFSEVDVKYNPYSGFIRVYNDADFTLNYIPNV